MFCKYEAFLLLKYKMTLRFKINGTVDLGMGGMFSSPTKGLLPEKLQLFVAGEFILEDRYFYHPEMLQLHRLNG